MVCHRLRLLRCEREPGESRRPPAADSLKTGHGSLKTKLAPLCLLLQIGNALLRLSPAGRKREHICECPSPGICSLPGGWHGPAGSDSQLRSRVLRLGLRRYRAPIHGVPPPCFGELGSFPPLAMPDLWRFQSTKRLLSPLADSSHPKISNRRGPNRFA